MGRTFLDIARHNLRDLDYFLRQLRFDAIEDSSINVEAADTVGGLDRAFDLDAGSDTTLGPDEFPTVPAMGSDLRTEDFVVHIEDNGFIKFGQLLLP